MYQGALQSLAEVLEQSHEFAILQEIKLAECWRRASYMHSSMPDGDKSSTACIMSLRALRVK